MPWTHEARKRAKGEHADHMTLGEVSRLIGISYRTAKRWKADGRLPEPAVRNERFNLYSPDQVSAIITMVNGD